MNIRRSLRYLGCVGALLFSADGAFSADRTYDGGGLNNLWSNEINWNGDTDITGGDVVIFGTSDDFTINNDLGDISISGITFAANLPTTTLIGNSINFAGFIQNDSGSPQVINLPLSLSGSLVVNDSGGTGVTIGGTINGGGSLSVQSGLLSLNSANGYTGGTITTGEIRLGVNDALGTGGFNFAGGLVANNTTDNSIGALTLSGNSDLYLSYDTTPGILTFDSASFTAGTLTISGWSGVAGVTGGDDQIFITDQPNPAFLSQINFTGFDNGAMWLPTGEIVPTTIAPVPEPTEWALIIFGTLAVLYKCVLPRFRKAVVA